MKHTGPGHYTLERFFTGELGDKASGEVRDHLKSCEECSNYIKALETEKELHLLQHPYRQWAGSHVQVAKPSIWETVKAWVGKPALFPVYGLTLALCIVVPVVFQYHNRTDVMYKGNSSLSFVFKRNGAVSEGTTRELFGEGDQIQVSYSYPRDHFAGLISIDSKGTVSTYQPQSSGEILSVKVNGSNEHIFPQSIVLDNSSGSELVVLLIADKYISIDDVRTWAEGCFRETPVMSELEKMVHKKLPQNVIECRTLLLNKR
ncbi:MAG TPA: hypothetical protein VHO70_22235 [Chitinispirillaceae bacterium]|nr:hypothetical protein [Chitinispirillaceae bacterium]